MATVTRQADTEAPGEITPEAPKTENTPVSDQVEVPYTEYQNVNNKPFIADYYELGDSWDEVYQQETKEIEAYLQNKVKKGEIADSLSAIKRELKEMEKMNDLKNEERKVIKVGILASYARFLLSTENIKLNYRKYGTN